MTKFYVQIGNSDPLKNTPAAAKYESYCAIYIQFFVHQLTCMNLVAATKLELN